MAPVVSPNGKGNSSSNTTDAFSVLIRVLAAVSIYMISGPSLIVVNRQLIKEYKFTYPLLISALGQVSSAIFCRVLVATGFAEISEKNRDVARDSKFILQSLLPVGLCQAVTLCCGNLVYNYLNLGFIQMLKSFTPVRSTTLYPECLVFISDTGRVGYCPANQRRRKHLL